MLGCAAPSPEPRLTPPRARQSIRATLLVAAYLALFLVASAVPPLLVALLLDYAGLLPVQTPARFDPGAPFQVLLYAASFVTVVGLTRLFCRRFDRRSLLDLGLRLRGPWLRHLAAGFIVRARVM